jgi:hypothetical protein
VYRVCRSSQVVIPSGRSTLGRCQTVSGNGAVGDLGGRALIKVMFAILPVW